MRINFTEHEYGVYLILLKSWN